MFDAPSYLLGQNSAIKKGMKVIVVDELPTTGEANVLYLVPKEDTGENDIFEEWLYVEDEWEKIGTTDIDLSNYYTKGEVTDITGLLANLQTTDKTNLVSAINELFANGSPIEVIEDNFYNGDNFNYSTKLKATIKQGVFVLKDTYSTSPGYIGIMFCRRVNNSTTQYWQEIIWFLDNYVYYGRRKINTSGTTTGYFTDPHYVIASFSSNVVNLLDSMDTYHNIRQKDIVSFYGSKTISNLTTTTKTSIVDAINEVNGKIGNINTVLATLTTPSNGGA